MFNSDVAMGEKNPIPSQHRLLRVADAATETRDLVFAGENPELTSLVRLLCYHCLQSKLMGRLDLHIVERFVCSINFLQDRSLSCHNGRACYKHRCQHEGKQTWAIGYYFHNGSIVPVLGLVERVLEVQW